MFTAVWCEFLHDCDMISPDVTIVFTVIWCEFCMSCDFSFVSFSECGRTFFFIVAKSNNKMGINTKTILYYF